MSWIESWEWLPGGGARATMKSDATTEMVNHPAHYGGEDNPYEHVKVAEAWGLAKDSHLYNCTKYLCRLGQKGDVLEELEKAQWYLERRIANERASRNVHGSLSKERVTQLISYGYEVYMYDGLWHVRRLDRSSRSAIVELWRGQTQTYSGEAWEAADRHASQYTPPGYVVERVECGWWAHKNWKWRSEVLGTYEEAAKAARDHAAAVETLDKAPEASDGAAATTLPDASDDVYTVLQAVFTPRTSVTSWRDHAKKYLAAMLRLVGIHPVDITWQPVPPGTREGATVQIVIWSYISPPRG